MKTLIIAEAGVNHNGDIKLAKQLIDVAANAGADIVKFQTFQADRLATHFAKKADYQVHGVSDTESQHEMLRRLELTEEMHYELIAYCELRKIGFLSTGFDIQSIDFLASLGQKCFKIPSGEITNLPYLRHIGKLAESIILSTGMSTLGEIESAIDAIELTGVSRKKIVVLHCTTEYPAPIEEVNLLTIQSIRRAFDVAVGYSDHTQGIEVAIAAVALGATVIEKHFTLNRSLPGPDHRASLEPVELAAMISSIRNIEKALGDGVKRLTPAESKNRSIARKSIVASCDIKMGEVFTLDNLTTKRPGQGISPMRWDEVIGKKSPNNFIKDDLIKL